MPRVWKGWGYLPVALMLLAACAELPMGIVATERPEGGYGSYQNLYERDFRGLPRPVGASVRGVGTRRAYPYPAPHLWKASLEVIGQYDAVAYLSPDEGIVVFAHGTHFSTRYYDTILAVHVEPRGPDGSAVHVAWLPPQTLSPAPIPPLPKEVGERDFENAGKEQLRELATAIVVQNFFAQLSVQALYKDRWKEKLGF